jgi:TRAP transporter TAXI family solute receptor
MFKRYFFAALVVLLFPLLAVPSVAGQDCQPTDKRLLTGSKHGYYYKLGTAIAQVARDEGLNICVQTTDRNLDNVSELEAGHDEFGIAQSDVAHDAWFGHPKRFSERVANVKIVMPLYVEVVHILLRPHLNISRLEDLKGKKVGVGLANSGTEYTAEHILAAVGLQVEGSGTHFEAVRTSDPVFCHSVQMLMNGTLDALFKVTVVPSVEIKVTVVPSVEIQDALKQNPDAGEKEENDCAQAWEIKLLPLDHDLAERLVRDGSYHETLIQKNDYGQTEGTLAVGVQALLLAGKSAGGDDVDKLAWLIRFKHRDIDKALEAIVNKEHQGHVHTAGNLPQLSLLNVPISALSRFVHPRAQKYVYHWWRDSWVPELPGILSTAAVIFVLLFWKRAALGRAIEQQPNLTFAIVSTLLLWLIGACVFYHFEWAVNEHFNSFLRSLASTFLYLASLSGYSLLTQDAQSFAQRAKWVSVVVLGGFASPLLKQGLDALLKRVAKRLQGKQSGAGRHPRLRVVQGAYPEASGEHEPPSGDQEMPDLATAPGAD